MSQNDSTIESKKEQELGDEPKQETPSRVQEDDSSDSESQWDGDDDATEIFKDLDLYLAARNGKLCDFKRVLDQVSAADNVSIDNILSRLSPAGNTFFHVAAKHGNEDIMTFIAGIKPSLVLSKNLHGETALHLAAEAGDESMAKALVKIQQENEPDECNLLRTKNKRGNTALHEALVNCWDSVAEYLIKQDPELSYHQNKDGDSALYLAAKAGFANCISLILQLSNDRECVNELFKKKSPMQAAIKRKDRAILEAIFDIDPSFIQLRDGEGRNPLHYAASLGYIEEVRYLHNKYAHNAIQRDKNGALPIHLASIEGHVDVVRLLLQHCPDPGELLDRNGRNILHLAAMAGRSKVVSYILKNPDLANLINMKDKRGNNPLHLATRRWRVKIVYAFTWDERVDLASVNDRGMTARDVADHYSSDYPQSIERLTWAILMDAGAPRALSGKTLGAKMTSNTDVIKGNLNIIFLVTSLVAAVTFAAGLTVPGGYNSSESDSDHGMATMLRHTAFHIFVFTDTVAMYSSIFVAVALLWAQFEHTNVFFIAWFLAIHCFGISLVMMPIAFTAGVYLVVSKLRWLSTAVLVMGNTFLGILLFLLLPLLAPPNARGNRLVRYLNYYSIRVLILLTSYQLPF